MIEAGAAAILNGTSGLIIGRGDAEYYAEKVLRAGLAVSSLGNFEDDPGRREHR